MKKKGGGFSISAKDLIKPVESSLEWAKQKQITEQVKVNSSVRIHESDNDLRKAELSSQREYERNYTEMMRVLTEHEEKYKQLHIEALIETIKSYKDIVLNDNERAIKDICLKEMKKLSDIIAKINDEKLSRSTAFWLNSIRKQIEEA